MNLNISGYQNLLSKDIISNLKKIFRKVNISSDSSICLKVSDEKEIKKLNKKYRNIDKVTDVLSFIYEKKPIIGDIIICYERALEQSIVYQHSLKREICFLFLHGLLHLLGYNHEKKDDEKIMFAMQEDILNDLKILRNLKKKTLFTGIKPTGELTIGHYSSIIKNLIKFQDDYEIFVMIADLHALTDLNSDQKKNFREICENIASTIYACGINCKVFIQSRVKEHLEFFNIISSYVSTNKLSNMIQYKENKKKDLFSSLSLFSYPVLMTADIFLYDCDLVVVGEDQRQHLELSWEIAKKINSKFPNLLKIPSIYIDSIGGKIMSLKNPEKKMSKSSDRNNSISFSDDIDVIKKKYSHLKQTL